MASHPLYTLWSSSQSTAMHALQCEPLDLTFHWCRALCLPLPPAVSSVQTACSCRQTRRSGQEETKLKLKLGKRGKTLTFQPWNAPTSPPFCRCRDKLRDCIKLCLQQAMQCSIRPGSLVAALTIYDYYSNGTFQRLDNSYTTTPPYATIIY